MKKLSDKISRKFIDVVDISDQMWEIESDTGFEPLTHINKTVKYAIYEVLFSNGCVIKCADTHIFMAADGSEIFAKDSLGSTIKSKSGDTTVTSVRKLDDPKDNMYDVTVDSKAGTFYSEEILSHNSTMVAAFFVWYTIFNADKVCAILANKAMVAREILARYQKAYENIPKFLQQGVITFNKGSVELENGSKIMAASTSSSAVRGFSIN